MGSTAIKVKNISLKYKFVKSMNIKKEIIKFLIRSSTEKRIKEVSALENVNFEIEKGKIVGVIGVNGAGKTTLLKVIAKIIEPDSGEIELHSDSVSLLTLGAGFQPELSGLENIYLNGFILGLGKDKINKKLKEIIGFSELEEFINYPIKTYSSGMRVRLAFSIASHIEPDILLLDEILGVGDEYFKEKSQYRIKQLIKGNRTVLIVSHSMSSITELCDLTLWINKGKIIEYDYTENVVRKYRNYLRNYK